MSFGIVAMTNSHSPTDLLLVPIRLIDGILI